MKDRLRLLQIIEATSGGVARHVFDLCGELIERGHEVHTVWSPLRSTSAFEDELLEIDGLRAHAIPMMRSPHPMDALALARIVAYGRSNGPFSLLHGHSSKGGALARMSAMALGRPAVYTPHAFRTADPTMGKASRAFYRWIERVLGAFSSEVIAVSEDERAHAVDLGLDPARTHVVLNGLDEKRKLGTPVDRRTLGIPEESIVIGFVGRLTHQKAPERLLELATLLNRPEVRWAVVGTGPLAKRLQADATRRGLDSRFHWLGARDGFATMRVFDVFLLPSRYEGLPYVLIEALTLGLPIVVNDVGGARHTVNDGVNGYIVEEGDLTGLADATRRLVDDARLRKRMGLESERLSRLFTLRQMADQTERIYRLAVAKHPL